MQMMRAVFLPPSWTPNSSPAILPAKASGRPPATLCFPAMPKAEHKPVYDSWLLTQPVSDSNKELDELRALGKAGDMGKLKKKPEYTNLGGAEKVLGINLDELDKRLAAMQPKLQELSGYMNRLNMTYEMYQNLNDLQLMGTSSVILVLECMRNLESRLKELYDDACDHLLDEEQRLLWDSLLKKFYPEIQLGKELNFARIMTALHGFLDSPCELGLTEPHYDFVIHTVEPLYRRVIADFCSDKTLSPDEAEMVLDSLAPADEKKVLGVLKEWEFFEASNSSSRNQGVLWPEDDPNDEEVRLQRVVRIFKSFVSQRSQHVKLYPETSKAALVYLKKYVEEHRARALSRAAARSSTPGGAFQEEDPWKRTRFYGMP